MALIKCPQCGCDISDRAKRCPKCGVEFLPAKELFPAPEPLHEQYEETEVDEQVSNSGSNIAFIVAVILLIIANAVLAAYVIWSGQHKTETSTANIVTSADSIPTDSAATTAEASAVAPTEAAQAATTTATTVPTDLQIMQLKGRVKQLVKSSWSSSGTYKFDRNGMLTSYTEEGEGGYMLTETFRDGRIVSSKYNEGGYIVTATFSYDKTSDSETSIWMKSSESQGRKLFGKEYYYKGRLVCRVTYYNGGYSTFAGTNVIKLSYDASGQLDNVDCTGGFYYCQPPEQYKVQSRDSHGNWTEANDPSQSDHEFDAISCSLTYYND